MEQTEVGKEKSVAQIIFDKVLLLREGQKLKIPFESKNEMLSKKVMIFNEKKRYEATTGTALPMFISQNSKANELVITVSTKDLSCIANMKIVDESGEEVPVDSADNAKASVAEKQRVAEMMRADGVPEEEIKDYLEEL